MNISIDHPTTNTDLPQNVPNEQRTENAHDETSKNQTI